MPSHADHRLPSEYCPQPEKCAFLLSWELEHDPPEVATYMAVVWDMERTRLASALGVVDECTCGTTSLVHQPDCDLIRIDRLHDRAWGNHNDAVKERLHRYWHDVVPEDSVSPFGV